MANGLHPTSAHRRRKRAQGLCGEHGCKALTIDGAYRCPDCAKKAAVNLQRFRLKRRQMEALARR